MVYLRGRSSFARHIDVFVLQTVFGTLQRAEHPVLRRLAGGGLFGLTVGTVTVSFASTIGATQACLVSRFLLRE